MRVHRAYRNRKLSEARKAANTTRSKVRARVEHVFGDQKNAMGAEIVRTIGIVRARCKIGMMNLVYNMRRPHLRANRGRVALSGRRARLFSRKIVGRAMRDHVRAELTIAALTMAIGGAAARPDPPFRSRPPPDYRKVLGAAGMIQAMRQKGNCWDCESVGALGGPDPCCD